ncbi:tetratricopeptide repeat protein [Listeria fleischmannii]|uniref:Uncharacterized protein n=1 Tax=Listeria fleischmannii TaxID=1069827 RepID=A0A841YAW8_9LIST|nr:hypothetical protein [Listeria fleischmannii]EIA19795.1 hypothetical protein KKC_10482 [Listeria fleischmannii subsp. coloradonensis]MBC1397415.1 hypothetical protein [Listeria fleischmannii]MBC1425784.1 hypothetical protein [Listeria fleischmannii]STY35206.1 Uncharacterised protein [Listeria fleischmannii subsp. coloradonensis]
MKGNSNLPPAFILKIMEERNATLSTKEQEEALQYLYVQHELYPCETTINHALIRLLNQCGNYEQAKMIGEQYLTMSGYNQDILSELANVYQNLNVMNQYFALIRQYTTDDETQEKEEETNIIPFPKKMIFQKANVDFQELSSHEQLLFLKEMSREDLTIYQDSFYTFLKDQYASPFVKSAIFEVLQEYQIDDDIQITKLDLEGFFNPKTYKPSYLLERVENEFAPVLENENPVLFKQFLQIMQHHYFIMYPFSFTPDSASLWGESYLIWVKEMYGDDDVHQGDIKPEIQKCLDFIRKIEEYGQNYLL